MKRKPFNKLWLLLAAALIPILVFIVSFIWMSRGIYDYKVFKSELALSVNYALAHDSLTAGSAGTETRLTADNADHLYRTICGAGYQRRTGEMPEEAGVTVSFGNGDVLRVWKYGERGLVVYYENGDGDYLFITEETIRYLTIERIVSQAWGNALLGQAPA